MEKKQGLHRLSKELKEQGWSQGVPLSPAPAPCEQCQEETTFDTAERKKTESKKEAVVMFDAKLSVPGVDEPSYLPPVVTLPAKAPCREFLAMSTLKKQKFKDTYETDKGLERGTIFPELDLPFLGEGGKKA